MAADEKIWTYAALILLAASLSGCGGSGSKDAHTIVDPSKIYAGTDGLILNFIENTPPQSVYEKGFFPVALDLQNKGASDITEGFLAVILDKEYMRLDRSSLSTTFQKIRFKDEEHITFELDGKSVENPFGSEDKLMFSVYADKLEKMSQKHKSPVIISACYGYKTLATQTVCIDADIYSMKVKEKSCEAENYNLDSQGGPIAVTQIEAKMGPTDNGVVPQFTIHIQNKAGGQAIDSENVKDACYSSSIEYDKWNIVKASASMSGNYGSEALDCNGADEGDAVNIMLKNSEAKFRCSYKDPLKDDAGTFSSVITIELDYGYVQTTSKEVEVMKTE